MAFVGRSRRTTGAPVCAATPATVGPGSYSPTSSAHSLSSTLPNRSPRLSYAPFSSSAERGVQQLDYKTAHITPGPGEYLAVRQAASAPLPASSTVFVSRVPRLEGAQNKQDIPGPGHYPGQDPWRIRQKVPRSQTIAKTKNNTKSAGGVSWVPVQHIPSIPNNAQSYGYEESALTGDLVAQHAPISGYSGSGTDRVGPGAYDIKDRFVSATVNTPAIDSWAKSGTHREMLVKPKPHKITPGPGAYNPKSVIHGRRITKKVTSQFASRVNRWNKHDIKPTPGPGSYSVTDSISRLVEDERPEQFQFFGSKSSRNVQELGGGKDVPGPGSYSPSVPSSAAQSLSLYDDHIHGHGTHGGSSARTPFASTTQRFTVPPDQTRIPGPGAYMEIGNLSYDLSKKVYGRNTSFSSTSQRFAPQPQSTTEPTTGPGSYNVHALSSSSSSAKKASSVFASASTRFERAKDEAQIAREFQAVKQAGSAGSGSSSDTVASMTSPARRAGTGPSSSFASTSARFDPVVNPKEAAWRTSLGPGTHDPARSSVITSHDTSSAFKSAAPRFHAGGHKSSVGQHVGPGSYSIENASSLIKPTFNITIATES